MYIHVRYVRILVYIRTYVHICQYRYVVVIPSGHVHLRGLVAMECFNEEQQVGQ